MLHRVGPTPDTETARIGRTQTAADGEIVDFSRIMSTVRRQYVNVIAFAVIATCLGIAHAVTTQPQYTASALVLIDNRQAAANSLDDVRVAQGLDNAAVDSQVELIVSENVIGKLIDQLDLMNNPYFNTPAKGLAGRIMDISSGAFSAVGAPVLGGIAAGLDQASRYLGIDFGAEGLRDYAASLSISEVEKQAELIAGALTQEQLEIQRQQVIEHLRSVLSVRRVGLTYVLDIQYTSVDPQLSADIVNGLADQYLTDQLDAKYEAARRASNWMEGRIQELKEASLAADLAVQRFRADNNLIEAAGMLVNEQQLQEINSQLVIARADTERTRARYERLRVIIETGSTTAAVSESIDSPIIADLRSRYLDASKRLTELRVRLGPSHAQIVSLRNEMSEYERLIFEELGRIAESLRNEYDIAQKREAGLARNLESLKGTSATDNETLVTLRELERESQTYQTLYQSLLQRYQESVQQQSYPITEARIITRASKPLRPSYPRKSLIVALSLVLGTALGVAVSFLRESMDSVFRTGSQVRNELGLEFFGMVWKLKGKRIAQGRGADKTAAGSPEEEGRVATLPAVVRPDPDGSRAEIRPIQPISTVYRYAVEHPMSSQAETLRSAKLAADMALHSMPSKVIGVVSCLPREGKTTVSKNLASLIALSGASTLLIDADLRNPGLTRAITPRAERGLVEAILNDEPYRALLWREEDTGLDFLPAVNRRRVFHTSEFLSSKTSKALLHTARSDYDYVVIDLPPLGPVIDARAIAPDVDGFVFVIEWGGTSRRMVKNILRSEEAVANKCLGVILNKAEAWRMSKYQNAEDREFYVREYKNYYYDQ